MDLLCQEPLSCLLSCAPCVRPTFAPERGIQLFSEIHRLPSPCGCRRVSLWRRGVLCYIFQTDGLVVGVGLQFTLNGRVCTKGKVDFTGSMPPAEAREFYERFVEMVKDAHAPELVKDGVFGAMMDVSLVNDGPVTVIIDSSERKPEAIA